MIECRKVCSRKLREFSCLSEWLQQIKSVEFAKQLERCLSERVVIRWTNCLAARMGWGHLILTALVRHFLAASLLLRRKNGQRQHACHERRSRNQHRKQQKARFSEYSHQLNQP